MLGERWSDAIKTSIRYLSGLDVEPSPEALLFAVSVVLERLKKAEGGGEWIDGLPSEPGRYWYARKYRGDTDWRVSEGAAALPASDGLLYLAEGVAIHEIEYTAIKHKPAPPLPEPPQ